MIEVARHGSRSPEVYLEYNKTALNFKGDSDLVQGGWNQHYEVGKSLRKKLIEEKKLLSPEYNSDEVYVQTTNANRTHMSAVSQLSGLYPKSAPANAWLNPSAPTSPHKFTINQVAQAENYFTRLNYNNCPRFKAAYTDANASPAYKNARGYFYETYKQDFAKLLGKDTLTWDQFDGSCEYLFFSQFTDINATAYDRQYCQAFLDGWIYKTVYGIDLLWQHSSFEFLHVLREIAQNLQGTRTLAQMTTF